MLNKFLVVFIFFSASLFAQNNNKVGLLLKALDENTKEDTLRVKLLIKLSNNYYEYKTDKMIEYSQKAIVLSKKIKYPVGIAQGNRLIGVAYHSYGDFKTAESYVANALSISKSIGNDFETIKCLMNLGLINIEQNNYPIAIECYQKALIISKAIKHSEGFTKAIYGKMAVILIELKDYDLALKYLEEDLAFQTRLNKNEGIANDYTNIGTVYYKKKDYQQALNYFDKALNINTAIFNTIGIAREYGNIANVQTELGNYEEAYENHIKALKINEEIKNQKGIADNYKGIGDHYLKERNFQKALEFTKKANLLAHSINLREVEKTTFKTLSEIFENKKNLDSAYIYYKKYIAIKDNLANENTRTQLSRLQFQHEFDAKEEKYKTDQLFADQNLNEQKLLLELNQSKLNDSNKERDLIRLNYLKTQSELEKEQLEKIANEKQLIISQKEKTIQKEKAKSLENEFQLSTLKFKELWLWGLLLIATIIVIGVFIILYFRMKSLNAKSSLANQKIKQIEAETRMKNEMREFEMKMLRSQMNPHFLFNSLNSINSFIIQQKSKEASSYLTTFSKLMRNILDNSRLESISIEKEIETLKMYLELESVRLEQKFDYQIIIDKNIDIESIKAPPLILQPFVENAIWHGLHNKLTQGNLIVEILQKKEKVVFKITDDGIGRKASALLQNIETKHKSFGIQITIDRIMLANKNNKFEITDLYNNEQQAIGTEVQLEINTEYND